MKRTAGILLYKFQKEEIQVLLVSNGRNWSIPKGAQSSDETPVTTALRELKEEANLQTSKQKLHDIGSVRKADRERMLCYLAKYTGGRPRPGNEIASARFFGLNKAMDIIQKYQIPFLRFAVERILGR